MCRLYDQVVTSSERPHLVQALLKYFIVCRNHVAMLDSYLRAEIERCADLTTLFRPATMCTSLMDYYMRTRCETFLRQALQEPITRIVLSNNWSASGPFELDPAKCADTKKREQNLANLQAALADLISSICAQSHSFPVELKYLFTLVKQRVHAKWQKQQQQTSDEIEEEADVNQPQSDKLIKGKN